MPRQDRPLAPEDTALNRFAGDLRRLREKAGRPSYRELAREAHYSSTTLSDAAGGRRLPTLAVVRAFVRACDGDLREWEQRWRQLNAADDESSPAADLVRSAETAYQALDDEDKVLARGLFLGLITFGEERPDDTARRARREELAGAGPRMEALLETLARTQLVSVGGSVIELSDDALITTWPRLREWRAQDGEDLRVQRRLGEAARLWESLGRDPGALLRGVQLQIIQDWARRGEHHLLLAPGTRTFLQACLWAEAQERDTRFQYERQLRLLTAGLVVLLIVLTGVAVLAFEGWHDTHAGSRPGVQQPANFQVDAR
jgi:hypothetical protein